MMQLRSRSHYPGMRRLVNLAVLVGLPLYVLSSLLTLARLGRSWSGAGMAGATGGLLLHILIVVIGVLLARGVVMLLVDIADGIFELRAREIARSDPKL